MRPSSGLRRNGGALLGALVGAIVALVGFGPAYIFGTSPFWTYPPTDFSSHLVGWREYVQEPWTFPLLLSRRLDEPDGLNILYMDSLPLVALVAKALRGLVPDSMRTLLLNPFGLWQLVSFTLQGAFAALLARSLRASFVAQVSCATVALSMQAFIARFHHTGLSSHFFILAALWLYVRASEPTPRLRDLVCACGRWVGLLVCSVLIHPYLFVMVGGVFAATVARWLAERRARLAIVASVVSVTTVVVVMAICGYFGARVSQASDWGFGYKSTDLLSFFVPQHSPFFPWRGHRMALDLARDEGAEGYDYLGIGVLGLAVAIAWAAPSAVVQAIKRNKALSTMLLLMTLFAVSNRVSIGGHVVLELPVPKQISWIIGQLRASGRFIWPPTYAAAIYLVVLAFRRFDTGRLALLPLVLVLLQFVDGMGNFGFVRSVTAGPERRWLDWSAFRPVIASYEGVTLRPSYSCVDHGHDYTVMMEMELQTMAAEQGIGISGVRSSRQLVNCATEMESLLSEVPDRRRLHVFFPPEVPLATSVHFEQVGLPCASFGAGVTSGFICGEHLENIPPGFSDFPVVDYEIGTSIEIGRPEAERYVGRGWSYGETTHRWTVGPRASIYLRTNAPVPAGSFLRARVGTAILPGRPRTTMTMTVNGQRAEPVVLTSMAAREVEVPMPPRAVGERFVEVHIATDDFRSPQELGASADARKLGVVITDIAIVPSH